MALSPPTAVASMPIDRLTPCQRPQGPAVMRQNWAHLLFLHWPVPPRQLEPHLPPGLELDTFAGQAYVGLVPFTMTGVLPVWAPAVPWLSSFHEVNVRTYVHRGGQDPGVWFFSLDAANPIAVWLARVLYHLPYYSARIKLAIRDSAVSYAAERRGHRALPASCALRYRVEGQPAPAVAGTLDHFLIERYILYSSHAGRLYRGRVHHAPYPVQPARLEHLEENYLAAAGVTPEAIAPLVHYAGGVNVEVFGLEEVAVTSTQRGG